MDRKSPLANFNLLPDVVDHLPRKRWVELAASKVDVDMLCDLARQWLQEGRAKDVRALLEPWFREDKQFRERYEPLFDLLLDAYGGLGQPRKKAGLLDRALAVGDAAIRSSALQRRVSIVADSGDYVQAWRLFQQAQRADPESPNLCHLELVLLCSERRDSEARERARFWVQKLSRRGEPQLSQLIEFARRVAEMGSSAMIEVGAMHDPLLDELLELWQAAPAPRLRYRLQPDGESAGPLMADDTLERGLDRLGRALATDADELGPDQELEWILVLRAHPELWDSFELLSEAADFIRSLPISGLDQTLELAILDRGVELLRAALRDSGAEGLRLEWGWRENRPALQLAAEYFLLRLDLHGAVDAVLEGLEWLVRVLNPNDNQGLRMPLMRALLMRNEYDRALSLSDCYPGDRAEMRYQRALALYRLGRLDQATDALREAVTAYPRILKWLVAENPRKPRLMDGFVKVGGDDEAWLFRQDNRGIWEMDDALKWAAGIKLPRLRRGQ